MLALAIVVVLGLLVGFLAGRAVGIQEGLKQAQAAASPETGTAAPAGDSQPKPFSEQDVAAPPASVDPPPVVGEEPPAVAPGSSPAAAPPASTAKPEAARPTVGSITVNSTPPGANVTIDKKWRGRTPLTLNDITFGTHEVRVVEDGYAVSRQEVTVSERTPSRTLSVQLKRNAPAPRGATTTSKPPPPKPAAPKPFLGTVYVDSRPRGARVFLDGKMVGVTPIRIPDVAIGSHVIRLQLEGHRDWSTSARVVAGEEERVTGSLDPIR
jgi:hypothetical protein